MIWQDIVITIANISFSYALITQIVKGFKEEKANISLQTGLLTALGLYMMVVAFFTLKLWFSSIISSFNGTLWLTLFLQSIVYENKH